MPASASEKRSAFGVLDLLLRREVDRRVVGDVDHVLAETDELSAHEQIVRSCVHSRRALMMVVALAASRPRYCGTVRSGAIGSARLEEGSERDRRRLLARADQLRRHLVDAGVHRIEEMLGHEKARNPVVGLVVDEDGAEQGLLGLDVVGRRPAAGGRRRPCRRICRRQCL